VYITFLFDVEDFIDPESDDAAKAIADLVTEEGARATMCIVGERARQWRARGRSDVIAALGRHDIAYHTNLHSIHPVVAEYNEHLDWEAGIAETLRREEPGVRAVREVFGVTPSCWGHPGHSWAPQAVAAMPRLGIAAEVYAYTRVPDGDVHRFVDSLSYPDGPEVLDRTLADTPRWQAHLDQAIAQLEERRDAGQQWAQVFLGHPTRILHEDYWDVPNFTAGRNPTPEAWVKAPRKSDADYATALHNLRLTVRALMSLPGIEIRTIREMNALFDDASLEPLTSAEQALIAPEIDRIVATVADWGIHRPDFDTTNLRSLTRSQLSTLARLRLAR
jgi:hypothetical protein